MNREHFNYTEDIAREFDYYIDSVVPERVKGRRVADFSGPKRHSVPGFDSPFLFTSFPEGGETNNAYLRALSLKQGDVVLDAGAYCGLTAHLFARAVGREGLVVAIEADPRNFAALAENIELSGAQNIRAVHAAVWSGRGVLPFQSEGNMGSSISAIGPRHDKLINVPTASLAEICADLGLTRIDHVKMDIEGAEYEALPAVAAWILQHRPEFIVEAHNETHDGPLAAVNVPKLKVFFDALGYSMSQVRQSEFEVFPLLHFQPDAPAALIAA